jgi:hypothetical protein
MKPPIRSYGVRLDSLLPPGTEIAPGGRFCSVPLVCLSIKAVRLLARHYRSTADIVKLDQYLADPRHLAELKDALASSVSS